MTFTGATRRLAPQSFLVEHRAKLHPQDVGLGSYGRRRVAGLRREEVAELMGVSARWYERFEVGSSNRRFSAALVGRAADALLLDDKERATLSRLAMPEVATAVDIFERSARDGALLSFGKLRDFARRVPSASSFEDAVLLSVETLQRIIIADRLSVASVEDESLNARPIATGPRASLADDVLARTVLNMNAPARTGATIICNSAPSPLDVRDDASHPVVIKDADGHTTVGVHRPDVCGYRHFAARIQHGSVITVGIFERGHSRGNISCFWSEATRHLDTEVDVLEAIGAILELCSGRSSTPCS